MSGTVYQLYQKLLDIKLNKSAFVKGCCKPDMPFFLRGIGHYREDSFYIVKDILRTGIKNIEFDGVNLSKEASVRIGIAMHFISDYFCYMHNEGISHNRNTHHTYEMILNKKLIKTNRNVIQGLIKRTYQESIKDDMDAVEFINYKYNEYINTELSYSRDVVYSLSIPAVIVSKLLLNQIDTKDIYIA